MSSANPLTWSQKFFLQYLSGGKLITESPRYSVRNTKSLLFLTIFKYCYKPVDTTIHHQYTKEQIEPLLVTVRELLNDTAKTKIGQECCSHYHVISLTTKRNIFVIYEPP